jgi:4-hydroxymandelate oxidase
MRSVREFEDEARQQLDPVFYDFIAGGAGDELTIHNNAGSSSPSSRTWISPRHWSGEPSGDLGPELVRLPGQRGAW